MRTRCFHVPGVRLQIHRVCAYLCSFQTDRASGTAITDASDVDFTDTSASAMEQVLNVLLQFYSVFPEFRHNELVITGESYGGLYTPNLGYLILEHNEISPAESRINFRSLLVGDPAIDWTVQMPTYADTLYGMGVIMLDERAELAAVMADSVANLANCSTAFNIWNQVLLPRAERRAQCLPSDVPTHDAPGRSSVYRVRSGHRRSQ